MTSEDVRVGFFSIRCNNPGGIDNVRIGEEMKTPSGKVSREGYTGEFNSGGDTHTKLTVVIFPDGRGVVGGQFKTDRSQTGDRIHFTMGLKNAAGNVVSDAPQNGVWTAPRKPIYPRDGWQPWSAEFTFPAALYDLIASFVIQSSG